MRLLRLVLVAALLPARALAEPPVELAVDTADLSRSLDDVVVLAAKRPQPLREAAASTSVITAADLTLYGWRNFSEALASLAGFYTVDTREFTYLGVRGASLRGDVNGRVLILVDGHTQQELWSNAAYPEQIGLDASQIDHLEVLRGPASALYGSLGFLAIINIVTRKGAPDSWARATFDMVNLHSFRGAASLGHRFRNQLELALHLGLHRGLGSSSSYPDVAAAQRGPESPCVTVAESERPPRLCNGGIADRETDAGLGFFAFAHLAYKGLSLRGSYQFFDKNLPLAPYQSLFNDRANRYLLTRGYVDLGYEVGRPSTLQAQLRAYYDFAGYSDDLAYSDDGTAKGRYQFHDAANPWWVGAEAKLLLEREWADRVRLAITGGGEVTYVWSDSRSGRFDEQNRRFAEDTPPALTSDLLRGAAYAQAELTYLRRLFLTLGARGDFSNKNPAAISPRAGIVLLPHPTTTFKLLYSRGFVFPSWYGLYFRDETTILDNPGLKPEQADNFELVYQQQLGAPLALTASVYYIQGRDLIQSQVVCYRDRMLGLDLESCPDPADQRTQRRNGASFQSFGAEVGLSGRFKNGARTFVNYSFNRATDESGLRARNAPEHMLKAGVAYPLWREHLFAGSELRFWSAREVVDRGEPTAPHVQLGAHVVWKDLPRHFTASLKVWDLTGLAWYEPSVAEDSRPIARIPHRGPEVQLRLSYGF